jgi:hypothetical protein
MGGWSSSFSRVSRFFSLGQECGFEAVDGSGGICFRADLKEERASRTQRMSKEGEGEGEVVLRGADNGKFAGEEGGGHFLDVVSRRGRYYEKLGKELLR